MSTTKSAHGAHHGNSHPQSGHRHLSHHHRHPRPSTIGNFVDKAPAIMQDLMTTFGLTAVQAAAVVGNLGTESANFTAYHERGQAENRGGYGWAQWTAARRRTFFAWADAHHLPRESDAASLGYLEHELQTTHRRVITHLKQQTDLTAATHVFMREFEGPGVPHESSRQTHATIAFQSYERKQTAQEQSVPIPRPR